MENQPDQTSIQNQPATQGQTLQDKKPQKEKTKRKPLLLKILVAGIVILTTLLVFGLIAYLVMGQSKSEKANQIVETRVSESTPTPNPTADWKTYENDEYKYSVKYPSNLVALSEGVVGSCCVVFQIDIKEGAPPLPEFFVSVIPNGFWQNGAIYNYPRRDFLETLNSIEVGEAKSTIPDSQSVGQYYTFTRLPDIKVAGKDSLVYNNTKPWEAESDTRVLVKHNDSTYMIGAYNQNGLSNKFRQFLSTFKFTDQEFASQDYLEIPELGIIIQLTDEINDLVYTSKTSNNITTVEFSTDSLVTAGSKVAVNGINYCAPEQGPGGSLSKIYKADLAESDDPNRPWWNNLTMLRNATKERKNENLPIRAKEFPDFFIFYTNPQATCTNNSTDLESSIVKAISEAIPTIELIQ